MKRIFLLGAFAISLLFVSCFKEKKKDNILTDLPFSKVVNDFYTWYIHENYVKKDGFSCKPSVIKVNDSTFKLDADGYIKVLKAKGFFTDGFIAAEKELISGCNNAIIKNKWIADEEPDFEGCEFMLYDRWVGGQGEDIDGFEITQSRIEPNKNTYNVEITIMKGKTKLFTSVVTLKEIGKDIYKIDAINLKFDE